MRHQWFISEILSGLDLFNKFLGKRTGFFVLKFQLQILLSEASDSASDCVIKFEIIECEGF